MNHASAGDWLHAPTFLFSGRAYRYFFHYHNRGWPPARCTERTIELALANFWLDQVDPDCVSEVGAVTPYYWPRRVAHVIDPVDIGTSLPVGTVVPARGTSFWTMPRLADELVD